MSVPRAVIEVQFPVLDDCCMRSRIWCENTRMEFPKEPLDACSKVLWFDGLGLPVGISR